MLCKKEMHTNGLKGYYFVFVRCKIQFSYLTDAQRTKLDTHHERHHERRITTTQVKEKNDNLKAGSPIHVSRMLATLGPKLHPILGDGNFRALLYIMYGTEDHHALVRASIALFSELNVDSFKKYCTSSEVMDHIRCMKHEAVFATQMEAHTAASCTQQCTLQLPEVHTFIGISRFVHNVWEIMICMDHGLMASTQWF